MRTDYYVYVISRNDGTPCYVGKGRGNRCNHHKTHSHNPWLRNIAKKHLGNIAIQKVAENLTNEEASRHETTLIELIGRMDLGTGPLVNFTDGGDGTPGRIVSQDERTRIAAALRGTKRPPEVIARMSAALKGRKRSAETIEKTASSNRGKKRSQQARANLSAGQVGRIVTPETREKMSVHRLGRPRVVTDKVIESYEARRGKPTYWLQDANKRRREILNYPDHPLYLEIRRVEDARVAKIAAALSRPKTAAEISANPALQRGAPKSQSHREALRRAQTGLKRSESHIRNSAEAHLGLKRTPETKEKMRAAQLASWGRRRAAAALATQLGI